MGTFTRDDSSKALRHYEEARLVHASPDDVFGHLDLFQNLSRHMDHPNWRMLWGWMKVRTDERRGQEVGSIVALSGGFLGIRLAAVERVTRREPPYRKAWQTFGDVHLVVIGHYTLGFEIAPQDGWSKVVAYIDYELPRSARARWLGYVLGDTYAKWCVREILNVALHQSATREEARESHAPRAG